MPFSKNMFRGEEVQQPEHPINLQDLIIILRKMGIKQTRDKFVLKLYPNEVCELYRITGEPTLEPVTEFK